MESLLRTSLRDIFGASPEGNAIAEAIRQRDRQRVLELLDSDPGLIRSGDETSNQPIHWATMMRQIDIIDDLVSRGADINAERADRARPVHLTNGDYSFRGWRDVPEGVETTPEGVLAHLISKGAYVDIWTAAHMGDIRRVTELLEQDPSLLNANSPYMSYYLGCGSALKNAAAKGHIDIVRLLLERGADPNLREEHIAPHGHALYSAIHGGYYDIIELLLEYGANSNAEVESSADCLSIAISRGDQRTVDLLCSYGAARKTHLLSYYGDVRTAAAAFAANPGLADDPGALENAISEGNDQFVRLMLQYQPDLPKRISVGINVQGPMGRIKSLEMAELLFDHGMDPDLRNWLEMTPLHQFARSGDVANAELFIDHGADIHARDEDICSTPLGWAAKFGQVEMVRLLLDRGAMPVHPDDPPWATPLEWAKRRGHGEIVRLLERADG